MLEMTHVTRSFGRTLAVDDVSLNLAAGDRVALWGPNGAGKTTLIRCVLGLLRYRGRIALKGIDIGAHGKAARRLIGYVPQELPFHDDMRVFQAVRFFGALKGLSRQHLDIPGVERSLAQVGLDGQSRKRMRELSGGMKQRLALAMALLGDPPLLLLDEVTASLDALGRDELVGFLGRLGAGGRTMLFASHRQDEVAALATRVVLMNTGKISRITDPEEFSQGRHTATTLHMVIAPESRERALASLRAVGFDARLNGVGLLVEVPKQGKAAPFRVLSEANIAVNDFEVLSLRAEANAQEVAQ